MPTTTTQKWLIGCGAGCLGLILVAVIVILGFTAWVNRPGELLQPITLLGPDTTGYAEWSLELEDAGTEPFVRQLLTSLQALQHDRDLPPVLGDVLKSGPQGEEGLKRIFPIVLAWIARPGEQEGVDLHLVTASAIKLGNRLALIDWALSWAIRRDRDDGARAHDHLGETIYEIRGETGGSLTFFIRGNDVFFTSDVATARLAVDRLSVAAAADRAPTEVERLFATTGIDAPLRGAISNARGEIPRLVDRIAARRTAPPPVIAPWATVSGATLTARLEEPGALAGTLELWGPDAPWAQAQAAPFAEQLRWLAGADSRLEVEAASAGERVRVTFRWHDLTRQLAEWVRAHADDEEAPDPAP